MYLMHSALRPLNYSMEISVQSSFSQFSLVTLVTASMFTQHTNLLAKGYQFVSQLYNNAFS